MKLKGFNEEKVLVIYLGPLDYWHRVDNNCLDLGRLGFVLTTRMYGQAFVW